MDIRLKEIIIYPIKSMGRISLNASYAETRGLRYDRRLMLVDKEGHFLSQRNVPLMARFRLSVGDQGFWVKYGEEKLFIPHDLEYGPRKSVTIWEDRLDVPEAQGLYSHWFSDHLDRKCHLVIMDTQANRLIPEKYDPQGGTVSFADGLPFLVTGTASLEELNQRLNTPVPMDRFRSNFVLSTEEPFLEDRLEVFKIGNAVFKRVKPCARCIITTTDQLTGARSGEPLHTLSKYRKVDQKVLFGQNLICLQEGRVKVGDRLILYS